ncbi:RidA family protein [Streptomyces sp. NPDC053431]|uniref:RidA family protein n=1 Tax=Streptomyces sp. NPDC053431 TaxID=3365703 RepID=UPI0037D6BCA8
MERKAISPWTWQEHFGFDQACETKGAQRTLWCTGQASTDDDGHPIHAGDLHAQLHRSFDNLETVLAAAGYSLADVVRLVLYATDPDALLAIWDELRTRLAAGSCSPALTLVGVSRLAYPELLVEIEATAVTA